MSLQRKKELSPFPKILSRILKDRKITLLQAAKSCGVSTSTIADWCNGTSPQDLMAVKKLSKFLSVSFSYLLTGEEEELRKHSNESLSEIFEEGPDLFDGYAQIIIKKLILKKEKKNSNT